MHPTQHRTIVQYGNALGAQWPRALEFEMHDGWIIQTMLQKRATLHAWRNKAGQLQPKVANLFQAARRPPPQSHLVNRLVRPVPYQGKSLA